MGEDLNMSSNAYSVVLLVFFISYVLFETPSNMILTRVRPSVYMPALMFVWGGLSMCFAAAQSWQAIAGLRFLLGILEASFAPGVLFLLSAWYKKGELGRRYSLYYTAVAISGIFGGLIAGGLLQTLDGSHGLRGWRWLFIVEGAATCAVSILAFFTLPDYPSTTRWLTPRERKIASQRLADDSLGDTQGGEKASHKDALRMALTDWRTWAFVVTYMATTGSQTIQYFIPSLVKVSGRDGGHGLGHSRLLASPWATLATTSSTTRPPSTSAPSSPSSPFAGRRTTSRSVRTIWRRPRRWPSSALPSFWAWSTTRGDMCCCALGLLVSTPLVSCRGRIPALSCAAH